MICEHFVQQGWNVDGLGMTGFSRLKEDGIKFNLISGEIVVVSRSGMSGKLWNTRFSNLHLEIKTGRDARHST